MRTREVGEKDNGEAYRQRDRETESQRNRKGRMVDRDRHRDRKTERWRDGVKHVTTEGWSDREI